MATRDNYFDMYSSYRSRDNYNEVYSAMINKLNSEVLKLDSVKSCLMVGPGDGQCEVQFLQQCAPNTSKIIAVEPDHESAQRLRARLEKSLPGVDSQVVETSIETWKGLDDPIDLAVIMLVLHDVHIPPSKRKDLFNKLHEKWLVTGGRVVVVTSSRIKCSGNAFQFLTRLGTPLTAWEDIESEFLEAGFVLQYAQEIQVTHDFSNPDEATLQLYKSAIEKPVTLDDIHNALKESFPHGKSDQLFYMFCTFQKS